MNVRFPRFKSASRRARNRVVALGVVAAFAVISAVGSVASASTLAPPSSAIDKSIEKLLHEAVKPDYSPKDMRVGAPGSVIASTLKSPSEINQWRANPQSWIDAKERLAGTSGLTTEDIRSTSRWAPKLLRGAGVAGWLSTGAELSYALRDGFLVPQLTGQNSRDVVNNSFCVRHGNIVTDGLGKLAGAKCAEWRLDKDFEALVGDVGWQVEGSVLGVSFLRTHWEEGANSRLWYCYTVPSVDTKDLLEPGQRLVQRFLDGDGWYAASFSSKAVKLGACKGFQRTVALRNDRQVSPALELIDADGSVIESMTAQEKLDEAEWITEVECADGQVRRVVSAAWQQTKLGAVARPASVQLDGCLPVKTRVGVQKAGTGITPGNPWHPTPAPGKPAEKTGTTTAVPETDVPQPVRDWLEQSPDCWDGSCVLTLKKNLDSGTKLDCFDNPLECLDWREEIKRDPNRYACEYAGKPRPIEDCLIYSRVFDRNLVQDGKGYANPEDGEPITQPGTGTGTGTRPATTNPGAATIAMNTPVGNPATSRECWPSGWGVFNPFEWVFQPVRCALEWAFVPRTAKITQVQTQIQLAAVNSKPVEIITGVQGWAGIVPLSDGCMGPVIEFNMFGKAFGPYHPLQACTGALVQAAALSKIALSIAFVIMGVVAISRYIARIFGYSGVGESGGAA